MYFVSLHLSLYASLSILCPNFKPRWHISIKNAHPIHWYSENSFDLPFKLSFTHSFPGPSPGFTTFHLSFFYSTFSWYSSSSFHRLSQIQIQVWHFFHPISHTLKFIVSFDYTHLKWPEPKISISIICQRLAHFIWFHLSYLRSFCIMIFNL